MAKNISIGLPLTDYNRGYFEGQSWKHMQMSRRIKALLQGIDWENVLFDAIAMSREMPNAEINVEKLRQAIETLANEE